jgi:hypothetical protein
LAEQDMKQHYSVRPEIEVGQNKVNLAGQLHVSGSVSQNDGASKYPDSEGDWSSRNNYWDFKMASRQNRERRLSS